MGLLSRVRDQYHLRGNVVPIIFNRTLDSTGWQMFEAVWQPYLLLIGSTTQQIGIISSTYLAFFAITQFLTGTLSDSLGRKKACLISYTLSLASIIAVYFTDNWLLIVPIVALFALVDAIFEPSIIALVAESAPYNLRGSVFSLLSLTWFLPGFFAPATGGIIADHWGFKAIIILLFVTELLSMILFSFKVDETLKLIKPLKARVLLNNLLSVVKPEKWLIRVYGIVVSNRFAFALFDGVLYAMIIEAHGYSALTIAFAVNLFTTTTALSLLASGRIVDRIGCRIPLIGSNLAWMCALTAYLLSSNLQLFFLAQMIKGLSIALWDPAMNTLVTSLTDSENRGTITGKVNGFRGLLTFPAPIIGASMFQIWGLNAPIILSYLTIIISTIMLFKLKLHPLQDTRLDS